MTSEPKRLLRVELDRGVATLTLDSPDNRNALSTPLLRQLIDALATAVADPTVRTIVLSHVGPVFCAGADLKETAAETGGPLPAVLLGEVLAAIWDCPRPVIARVGGPARAGGLGLIAAADIAVCALDATFAFTEVRLGVVPAVVSAPVLRRIQHRAAAELFLTGDTFDGPRAAQIGLVTAAVPAESLDATVATYCQALARGGPAALTGTKELLQGDRSASVSEELTRLATVSDHYFRSAEGREGVLAFREKRAPRWVP